MNPQKDHDFVAQLAQFSNLEQAIEQNKQLEMLQMASSAMVNSTNTNLIGKEIVANGDVLNLLPGKAPSPVAFQMGDGAQSVMARVVNGEGKVVKSIDLGALNSGQHNFQWDGTDDKGDYMPAGVYRVDVRGMDGNGRPVPVELNVRGLVTGVTYENGFPELLVGNSRVQPADILEIHASSSSGNSSSESSESGGTGSGDTQVDEDGQSIEDIAESMIENLQNGGGIDIEF